MPYTIVKRSGSDSTKSSPLKVVSPIIRKYAEQRQKRTRISVKIEKNPKVRDLKAILPKDGTVSVEPDLILSVNPSEPSTITVNSVPKEIAQPVQEICAIARLMRPVRTPRKRSGSSSKKNMIKQGKLVESAFELLKPDPANVVNAKEQAYAENYIRKVQATFSGRDDRIFHQFRLKLAELESKDASVVKVYKEISELFSGHADLIEDFLPFLSAEQALECGVFMEHLLTTKMTDFLALVDAHFAKSPYQIKKIHTSLEKILSLPDIGTKEICSAILPLMKGNAVLTDFFLELLPSAQPPDPLTTDFEELDEEGMSDWSEDGKCEISERVELPNLPDPYGGTNCICSCHEVDNEKFRTRTQHCIPCSTKFINGKIFIRSGKFLRRATITFSDHDIEFHRRRLLPHPGEPRKRKRSCCTSPTKSTNVSSDDHRSDLDDEDKSKPKGRQRTPRSKAGKGAGKVAGKGVDNAVKERDSKRSLKWPDGTKTKGSPSEKRIKFSDSSEVVRQLKGQPVADEIHGSSVRISPNDKKSKNRRQNIDAGCIHVASNTVNFGDAVLSPRSTGQKSKNGWPDMEAIVVSDDPSRSETVSVVTAPLVLDEKQVTGISCPHFVKSAETVSFGSPPLAVSEPAELVQNTDVENSESAFFVNILSPQRTLLKVEDEGSFLSGWQDAVPTGGDTVSFITAPEFFKEEVKSPFAVNVLSPKQGFFKSSGEESYQSRWQEVDADVPTGSDTVSFITLSKEDSKSGFACNVLSPKHHSQKAEIEKPVLKMRQDTEMNHLYTNADAVTFVATSTVLVEDSTPLRERGFMEDMETDIQNESYMINLSPEPKLANARQRVEAVACAVAQATVPLPVESVFQNSHKEKMEAEVNRQSPPVISIPESGAIPSSINPLLSAVENSPNVVTDSKTIKLETIPSSSTGDSLKDFVEEIPWKLEEDRVILHTLQTETYCEETFVKIADALPLRTIEVIKKRFQELLNILYKMKAEAPE